MTKLEKKMSLLNRANKLEKIVMQASKFTNRSVTLLFKACNLRQEANAK